MKTPNPRPLYEIGAQYTEAMTTLADLQEEGLLTPEAVADTLEGLEGEFDAKAVAVGAYARSLDAEIELLKSEEQRLANWRKRLAARQESITAYLFGQMQRLGKTKIEGVPATLTVKKNPPSVVVDDLGALPSQYVGEEIVYTADKQAIGRDLKAGIPIEGAHLETKLRLEIK